MEPGGQAPVPDIPGRQVLGNGVPAGDLCALAASGSAHHAAAVRDHDRTSGGCGGFAPSVGERWSCAPGCVPNPLGLRWTTLTCEVSGSPNSRVASYSACDPGDPFGTRSPIAPEAAIPGRNMVAATAAPIHASRMGSAASRPRTRIPPQPAHGRAVAVPGDGADAQVSGGLHYHACLMVVCPMGETGAP